MLPSDIQLSWYVLVESALSGGVALLKVDAMRPFLEKYGRRLTSSAHLSELIPAVLDKEKKTWLRRWRSKCATYSKTWSRLSNLYVWRCSQRHLNESSWLKGWCHVWLWTITLVRGQSLEGCEVVHQWMELPWVNWSSFMQTFLTLYAFLTL